MALNKEKFEKIKCQYTSYTSFSGLVKDIMKSNDLDITKIKKIFFILIIDIIFSYYCVSTNKFMAIFTVMSDINITVSVTLLALLIAGFTIVLSSLNKNSLYMLILHPDNEKKENSFFKKTILLCIEPLVWFIFLLIISFSYKILNIVYPKEFFSFEINYIIKIVVLFSILSVTSFSLISLKTFILNMCNLLIMYANFEILERKAESEGKDIKDIIKNFENM
jgi:hypothetical protein